MIWFNETRIVFDTRICYTIVKKPQSLTNIIIRPKGTYLCAYNIGAWNKIPKLYEKMLEFANKNKLILLGNAYEIGINRLSNLTNDHYITEIVIQCQQR